MSTDRHMACGTAPRVGTITRAVGPGDRVAYTTKVTYPYEKAKTVIFVGSLHGGPVVMVAGGTQVFVTDPGRFGQFGRGWVRRFFGERAS